MAAPGQTRLTWHISDKSGSATIADLARWHAFGWKVPTAHILVAHLCAGSVPRAGTQQATTRYSSSGTLMSLTVSGSARLTVAQPRLDYALGAAPRHLRTASSIEPFRLGNLELPDAGQGQRSSW